ncbi:MAG: LCP family protein [Anaerolineae bacterium]|nr:LCP family protein [Anaerolineae bacterium]
MVKQIIMYVALIALLLFVLIMVGAGLFFTLTGSGASRSQLSFVTTTPNPNETAALPTAESQHAESTPVLESSPHVVDIPHETSTPEVIHEPQTEITHEPLFTIEGMPTHEAPLESTPAETTPVETVELNGTPVESSDHKSTPAESSSAAVAQCGLTKPANLLLINTGSAGESSSSLSIRLMHIDPTKKSITVISPSCNLWVNTPSLVKDYTISAMPLCSVMLVISRSNNVENGPAALATALKSVINDNLGIKVDYTTVSSTASIKTMVAQAGSIEVNAAEPASIAGIDLQSGPNQLDASSAALLYGSSPSDVNSWVTINRQNEIIAGLFALMGSPDINLVDMLQVSDIQTDMSEQTSTGLACTLKQIPADKLVFSDIVEQNTQTNADGLLQIIDKVSLQQAINTLFK